jgi:hypothetical protein
MGDDVLTAIGKLQDYLTKYEGNAWINATKFIVTALTDVLLKGQSPVVLVAQVLEYVYQTFIKHN